MYTATVPAYIHMVDENLWNGRPTQGQRSSLVDPGIGDCGPGMRTCSTTTQRLAYENVSKEINLENCAARIHP